MLFTRPRTRPAAEPAHGGSASRAGSAIVLVMPVLALLGILAVWQFTDLRNFDAARFAEVARTLRESPAGFGYTLLVFTIGTLLFVPVTPLVLGVTLTFEPLRGFAYAMLALLLASSVTYGAGRLLGSSAVERLGGPRLERVARELHANAFRASVAMRLLPVGHFTVLNLLAGSLRIPFRWYILGNLVGIVPGTLVVTLFGDQVGRVLRSPDARSFALAGGCFVAIVALAFGARHAAKRRARRLAPDDDRSA